MELNAPYDLRLEQEVLGSMLVDPACIADIADVVKPEHFYIGKYQKLCKKILDDWNEDEKRVDLSLMAPFFEREGIMVSELLEIPSTATVRYKAENLKDLSMLREAVQLGRQMATMGNLRERQEIREALNQAENRLAGVTATGIQAETTFNIKDVLSRVHDKLEYRMYHSNGITGLPSGLTDLDEYTAGFQKQDLIVVAARPSMGKTALALQIADQISRKEKKTTLFFELEMSEEKLTERLIANIGNINGHKLNTGLIDEGEYEKVVHAMTELCESELVIDVQPAITIAEMKAKARKVKRDGGLDCIIVDYIGLIGPPERGMSRYDQVSENTRQLKQMAREFDVPVIALSQLSRSVEQRQDKRPMLSDLRESGEVEQTADVVMFLYRDDYYDEDSERKNIAEIIIAKQRNGPVGPVETLFIKHYNKFLDLRAG